jgi:NadR type nicotinamide-nucleotide adenylyltransferase
MKRIAIIGPECSGKTTLCEALAHEYRTAYTKEYARHYLEENGPGYVEMDLMHIAAGQLMVEAESQELLKKHGGDYLFCDTDMLTIRIWSEEKFGRCTAALKKLSTDVRYDHWLLCAPDMPWEADPLRENPHDRARLFGVYEKHLNAAGRPYTIIGGPHEERMRLAVDALRALP